MAFILFCSTSIVGWTARDFVVVGCWLVVVVVVVVAVVVVAVVVGH